MNSRSHVTGTSLAMAAWMLTLGSHSHVSASEAQPRRIKIEYVAPKDPAHQSLYEVLRERRVLERMQRLYSPFRLPTDLTIRTAGCDGVINAWYGRGNVTLCYELISLISQPMPKGVAWAGITDEDAAVGQFLYIAGHEVGHAMFDLLNLPITGSAEDAADQFSTYLMLRLGREQARRLISGSAYYFRRYLQDQTLTLRLESFSGEHSQPQQRFYNQLCLAYGADATTFAELVSSGFLPEKRSKRCLWEYGKISAALQTLFAPHIDTDLAKSVLDESWLRLAPQ